MNTADEGQRRLSAPSSADALDEWLIWLETIHPVSIDMGLERVTQVAERLNLRDTPVPLILVGGTNGKGSTVGMLTAIYVAAGYCVGSYMSPHVHDFKERIQVNGEMAGDTEIVEALAFVESSRLPQTLTYFEYTTLAAMRVFQQRRCDVYVLEVGLGGRLDATNLWDADCSVVTSIALDHEEYLGSDLSLIATEKAAIGRAGKVLVVGDPAPPDSLFRFAEDSGITVNHVGALDSAELPQTRLAGIHQRRNAACARAVVETLSDRLPVAKAALDQALQNVVMPARFEELLVQGVPVLLDVAHNPAGAAALADAWSERFPSRPAQVIFACLADKDLDGIVSALAPITAHWHIVPLAGPRAIPSDELVERIRSVMPQAAATSYSSAAQAWEAGLFLAGEKNQAILVAGSFHTIADIRCALEAAVHP